jgi:hypothetical protein
MTTEEVTALSAKLATDITELVRQFETTSKMSVHSLPVVRDGAPVKIRVKVMLP